MQLVIGEMCMHAFKAIKMVGLCVGFRVAGRHQIRARLARRRNTVMYKSLLECVGKRRVAGFRVRACVCVLWLLVGRRRLTGRLVLYAKRQMEVGCLKRWRAVVAFHIVHG